MNKIIIVGRLVKDPELKVLKDEKMVCRAVLASDGEYSKKQKEKAVDFIPITLWGSPGKVFSNTLKKGDLVNVTGTLKIRSYEVEGSKKYSTEVNCDDFHIIKRVTNQKEQAN